MEIFLIFHFGKVNLKISECLLESFTAGIFLGGNLLQRVNVAVIQAIIPILYFNASPTIPVK